MLPSELLADETKWIKGSSARNKSGAAVDPGSTTACRWCMVGAIERCGICFNDGRVKKLSYVVCDRAPFIAMFNDHERTTHADVIRVLKECGL